MEFQKWPKIPRFNRDIIITEKIDGTNAQIHIMPVKPNTNMSNDFKSKGWVVLETGFDLVPLIGVVPGSRNRYLSTPKDNYGFANWVNLNAKELSTLGFGRHYGEWWGKSIQRNYDMDTRKLSLFHTHNIVKKPDCVDVVPTLYEGMFDMHMIHQSLIDLREHGSVAAPGFMKPEGIVIFHTAANQTFKITLENDEVPKGQA